MLQLTPLSTTRASSEQVRVRHAWEAHAAGVHLPMNVRRETHLAPRMDSLLLQTVTRGLGITRIVRGHRRMLARNLPRVLTA